MNLRVKFRAEDLHWRPSEQICCFDEVFLMALTSTEQLSIERPLHRKAATGGVLLEKVFLEISQDSQENTCGKVPFLIRMQAEGTASDLSQVFCWKFLVYFISVEKWNKKGKYPDRVRNVYFLAWLSICLTSKISKEIWQTVTWCCSFHG